VTSELPCPFEVIGYYGKGNTSIRHEGEKCFNIIRSIFKIKDKTKEINTRNKINRHKQLK